METKEVFKDIIGYKGLYQVSNLGNVKSLKRFRVPNDRILRAGLNSDGYLTVALYKDKKSHSHSVHQLVAKSFLSDTNHYTLMVDHKDNIRTNNEASNLQYITNRKNSSKDQFKQDRTSNYIGVSWNSKDNKWQAQIKYKGSNAHLGSFDNEKEAAKEYQTALYYIDRFQFDDYPFELAPMKNKRFMKELEEYHLRIDKDFEEYEATLT